MGAQHLNRAIGRADKGKPPGEELVEDDTERVEIGPARIQVPLDRLGR
jgi:hypothetical protein